MIQPTPRSEPPTTPPTALASIAMGSPVPTVTPTPRIIAAQTIGDVTVTLNWAYADANRVAVRFTIAGVKLPDGLWSKTALNNVILADAKGTLQLGGGSYTQPEPGPEPNSWVYTYSEFPSPSLKTNSLDLTLTVSLGGQTLPLMPKDWTPTPGPIPDKYMVTIPPIGDFVFNFTIPVYPAVELKPQQIVAQNGITMTLQSLSISPSVTNAVVCYNLPDRGDWMPEPTLTLGGNEGLLNGGFPGDGVGKDDFIKQTYRCSGLGFLESYAYKPARLKLQVDSIHTSTRFDLPAMKKGQAELRKQGIEIAWSCAGACGTEGGYNVEVKKAPPGVTNEEAYRRFEKYLQRRVEGPWIFEIDIP